MYGLFLGESCWAVTMGPRALVTCSHSDCGRCAARSLVRPLVASSAEVPRGCPNRTDIRVALARLRTLDGAALRKTTRAAGRITTLPGGTGPSALTALVERGELVLCEPHALATITRGSFVHAHAAPAPPPAELTPPVEPTTWIEVQLLDEECEPVPGERYRLTLPNGTVIEGRLNYLGRARHDDIEKAGACRISFPDLDQDAWRTEVICPDRTQAPPLTFVEFKLVDMEGDPIAGELYRVTLPDGSSHEGFLGPDGEVRYDDLPSGSCRIAFPNLDADAWEAVPDA